MKTISKAIKNKNKKNKVEEYKKGVFSLFYGSRMKNIEVLSILTEVLEMRGTTNARPFANNENKKKLISNLAKLSSLFIKNTDNYLVVEALINDLPIEQKMKLLETEKQSANQLLSNLLEAILRTNNSHLRRNLLSLLKNCGYKYKELKALSNPMAKKIEEELEQKSAAEKSLFTANLDGNGDSYTDISATETNRDDNANLSKNNSEKKKIS
jgi:hypothetical protein